MEIKRSKSWFCCLDLWSFSRNKSGEKEGKSDVCVININKTPKRANKSQNEKESEPNSENLKWEILLCETMELWCARTVSSLCKRVDLKEALKAKTKL